MSAQESAKSNENESKANELPCLNITFIGNGKMASALGLGIIKSNILGNNSHIVLSNRSKNFSDFESSFNKIDFKDKTITLSSTTDNIKAIENANMVFLCVKPDVIPMVLKELESHWKGSELVISIAAGVMISAMEAHFPAKNKQKVIRVMPNTPALVSCMAGAMCAGSNAAKEDMNIVLQLLECIGICKEIPSRKEYLMDSIVGLAGSGPAYAYMFIEALADGGVKCGLTRKDSLELAAQTVLGAAKMVLETGIHPAILKDNVASPGGTTIAAIQSLEKNGFRYAVIDAVEVCTKRASELGQIKEH